MEDTSPKYQLNKTDLAKVGRFVLISLVGWVCTVALQYVTQFDFGVMGPIIIVGVSAAAEAARRWAKDNDEL